MGLKMKMDYILVFFRRVLCVLDTTVRTPEKPFRVMTDIGMIHRTLKGQVKGDFQIILSGLALKVKKVVKRAQLGMYGCVAAVSRAYGPGAPRIVGLTFRAVVFTFPVGYPYWVYWGQIDNIKTHLGNFRKKSLAILESTMFFRSLAPGPGEKFVPGTKAGSFPFD